MQRETRGGGWLALAVLTVLTACTGGGSGSEGGGDDVPVETDRAPSDVLATAGVREAQVQWSAPRAPEGGAVATYLVRAEPGGASLTVPGTERAARVGGLSSGGTYTFTVTAQGAQGQAHASAPSAPVTLPQVPGAPVDVAVAVSPGEVTVTWKAPASDGGRPVTGYRVTPSAEAEAVSVEASPPRAVLHLPGGRPYRFSVVALNAVGEGPAAESTLTSVPCARCAYPGLPAQTVLGEPRALVTADFDHDGTLDVAVAKASDASVEVLRGMGDGTFTLVHHATLGMRPSALAVGDLDADGRVDVVAVGTSVSVMRGRGDGTLMPRTDFPFIQYRSITAVVLADVTDDGRLDVVTGGGNAGVVSVYPGAGGGQLGARQDLTTGGYVTGVVAADLDGDGRPDLAATLSDLSSVAVIRRQPFSATWGAVVTYPTGDTPQALVTADVNADGKQDLLTADLRDGSLGVLLGRGDGTLRTHTAYDAGTGSLSLATRDLDHDGRLDVVVGGSGGLAVLGGRGDGSFESRQQVAVAGSPQSVALADLDGDGRTDAVTVGGESNSLTVLPGLADGTFLGARALLTGGQAPIVAAADLNADGKADLVTVNSTTASVLVLLGRGDGTFAPAVPYPARLQQADVQVLDVNGDGKQDVVVTGQSEAVVSVFLGRGDGTLEARKDTSTGPAPAGMQPVGLTSGDFNRDGKRDLATANWQGNTLSVLLGRGNGTFEAATTWPTGYSPVNVEAADVDGDGVLDLVSASSNDGVVSVHRGLGDGTFAARVTIPAGNGPRWVQTADLDRDGVLDIAVTNSATNGVSVLRGLGGGAFGAPVLESTGEAPSVLRSADLDGDGTPELVVTNFAAGTASVMRRGTDGHYPRQDFAAGNLPQGLAVADLDGDGRGDLVTSQYNGPGLAVLMSRPR